MKNNFIPLLICRTFDSFSKILSAIFSLLGLLFSYYSFSQYTIIDSLGEAYVFHSSDYPKNKKVLWGNNDALTNGITHDDNCWYFTVLGTDYVGRPNGYWQIIRIPVEWDLANIPGNAVIVSLGKDQVPELQYYDHAGDLDHYKDKNGRNFLAVPMTGHNKPPIIAFFEIKNDAFKSIKFIDYAILDSKQKTVGWCAINPKTGDLYTSADEAKVLIRYTINWNALLKTKKHSALENASEIQFHIPNANILHNFQGGEFTPSGNLLYVNTGVISACGCNPFSPQPCPCDYKVYADDGLHVFNTTTWQEIQHSTSNNRVTDYNWCTHQQEIIHTPHTGCFNYTFDNTGCSGEEPEGLTIWDMDKVPNHDSHITGQLHVISYNHSNNFLAGADNFVSLKHYKRFNFPHDIAVYSASANGEPATNPAIAAFLNQGTTFGNCAGVLYNHPPAIFPPGKTPVVFTVTDYSSVKVQNTVYVTVINIKDYLVFPNPTNNYIEIKSINPQTVQIKLINAQGTVVHTYNKFNTDRDRIDLNSFQNGIYFINIFNGITGESTTKKIVKITNE